MDINEKTSEKFIDLVKRIENSEPSQVVRQPAEKHDGSSELNQTEQTMLLLLKMRLNILNEQLSIVQQQFAEALENLKQKEKALNRLMPEINSKSHKKLKTPTLSQLSQLDEDETIMSDINLQAVKRPHNANNKSIDESKIFINDSAENVKLKQNNENARKELNQSNYKLFDEIMVKSHSNFSGAIVKKDSGGTEDTKCHCTSIEHLEKLKRLFEENGLVWITNNTKLKNKTSSDRLDSVSQFKKANSCLPNDTKRSKFPSQLTVETQTSGFALLKNKRLHSIQPVTLDIHMKNTSKFPPTCIPFASNYILKIFDGRSPLVVCTQQSCGQRNMMLRECCGGNCNCGCNTDRCLVKPITQMFLNGRCPCSDIE